LTEKNQDDLCMVVAY